MSAVRVKVRGDVSAVYHCMSRVVGKQRLLGALEKEVFRGMMWRLADFSGVEVLTYAVMDNHFHVLVRTPGAVEVSDGELVRRVEALYGPERARALCCGLDGPGGEALRAGYLRLMGDVSAYIKALKQRFSIWYNRRYGRVGTLWSERFKSVLVESGGAALRTVAAYIDLNGVRAGCCADPKDYRWSGYAEALAGGVLARRGLRRVMEQGGRGWRRALWEYRVILYGKGSVPDARGRGVSAQAFAAERAGGGRMSVSEMLRFRVRYFTDGTVLGGQEFVERCFREHRDKFGAGRRSGARRMRGGSWGGLCTARDLRRDVFG